MMKLLKTCIFSSVLLLGCSAAYAADADTAAATASGPVKIGILDMQQIMRQSPEVSSINKELQNQFKPRQEKLAAAQKSLNEDMDKYKKNVSVMSNADKSALEAKINAEQMTYAKEAQSFQQDLSKAENEGMQKFMTNLQTAVNTVAKEDKYTLILNRAAVPYFDSNLDVTKEILKKMEK
jgi:outer membrane protein